MKTGKRGFLAIAPAFVAAAFMTVATSGYSATDNAQERRDSRDHKQEGRQQGRKDKVDCRQADQKSNSACRQGSRDNRQDTRKEARDIKYK